MSDIEEPPAKVTKFEMSQTFTQVEEMEEGQEEWLSEGLLTDDDYNPENPDNSVTEPDHTKSDLDSLDTQSQAAVEGKLEESLLNESVQESVPENQESIETSQDVSQEEPTQPEVLMETSQEEKEPEPLQKEVVQEAQPEAVQESIEETVQEPDAAPPTESRDNSEVVQKSDPVKVDDRNIEQTLNSMDDTPADDLDDYLMKNEGQKAEDVKAAASDGNDTDDLLRMLEDDDKSKKAKKTKMAPKKKEKIESAPSSDEEDDFLYNSTTVKKVILRNSVTRKATKAEPESSGEESSLEEINTSRPTYSNRKIPTSRPVIKQVIRVSNTAAEFRNSQDRRTVKTSSLRQYGSTRGKSVLKPTSLQTRTALKGVAKLPERTSVKIRKPELEEIINEEEFLEEDDFDLRDDFAEESDSELDKRAVRQRIMRPEVMDEEIPTDDDSDDDDASVYDELPTSDEELEEWFTLDIRKERAGEYLPLLGKRAFDLLIQEKARVSTRLSSLREDLAALNTSGKQQADKVRRATAALAEVDDMLKAA